MARKITEDIIEKQIKEIIEITATIDERDNHVWGKDTDLGSYHEIASDVREKLIPLIIDPIMIDKDMADMVRKLGKRVVVAEERAMYAKSEKYMILCRSEIQKKIQKLKHNLRIINKEYHELLMEWYQLKYTK